MIRTAHDACCFCLLGLLLPAFGAAWFLQTLAPLAWWLVWLALLLTTERKK